MLFKLNCRQCGGELDIFEFGPGRICPHCGKETVSINIKEVHISFGDTAYENYAGLCDKRNNRFLVGIDYLNVCFAMELSMGDILSPPCSNSFAYAHQYSSHKSMKSVMEKQMKKLSQAKDDAVVYLWISEKDVNAYLNLLKFSKLFKRFEEVYIIRCDSEEETRNDKNKAYDPFANRIRVTSDELDAMTLKYLDILKLGGEYRVGCYGDVRVCTQEYLEEFVMSQMSEEYLEFDLIYKKVYKAFWEATGYAIRYNVVQEIIWRLMTKRKIKSHGECGWWGDSFYNNMLCTQRFHLDSSKSKTYTCEDALEIVCHALKNGYTRLLYDIMADDAVLKFKNGEEPGFNNKKDIIGFIENDGSLRINVNKEKVSCEIFKKAEGEHPEIKHTYILLCYERKNGENDCYILEVCFENNRIVKIQIRPE